MVIVILVALQSVCLKMGLISIDLFGCDINFKQDWLPSWENDAILEVDREI